MSDLVSLFGISHPDIIQVAHNSASGSYGGAAVVGFNNYRGVVPIYGTTGSAGAVLIPKGVYLIIGFASHWHVGRSKNHIVDQLGATIAHSTSAYGPVDYHSIPVFNTIKTISVDTEIDVRAYCQLAKTNDGLGLAGGSGLTNCHCCITFIKVDSV